MHDDDMSFQEYDGPMTDLGITVDYNVNFCSGIDNIDLIWCDCFNGGTCHYGHRGCHEITIDIYEDCIDVYCYAGRTLFAITNFVLL